MNNRGQTIIEAVVALGAIIVVLTSVTVIIIGAVYNSGFIKDQALAGKYAQQGMETVRYLRNNDPNAFFTYNGTKCLNQDNKFTPTTCNGINVGKSFHRDVTFSQGNTQCGQNSTTDYGTKVTVSVSWKSSKCQTGTFCHSSTLVSCFSTIPKNLKDL